MSFLLEIKNLIYNNGINYTIVFSKGDMFSIKKRNASGAEPMVRFIKDSNGNSFMSEYLSEHIFEINDKKLVVLNCMEYYKQAYYIARSIPDLFGIICICSNNNVGVFLDETKAIHNHNENIYTFMINSVNIYMGKKYALGESYVYGPIQGHEKEWLVKEGISMNEQGSDEEYFYGEFMSDFSRFGRSDNSKKYRSGVNKKEGIEIMKLKTKKNSIITSGPTNERLDAVMKITNMSTGALGAIIANHLMDNASEWINKLYYISSKLSRKPKYYPNNKLEFVEVESTDDLLNTIKDILTM